MCDDAGSWRSQRRKEEMSKEAEIKGTMVKLELLLTEGSRPVRKAGENLGCALAENYLKIQDSPFQS